jgi:hypothetical protein
MSVHILVWRVAPSCGKMRMPPRPEARPVRYSTQYYKFSEEEENIIRPDHEVATTWEEYKAGRDAALKWVLQFRTDGK